MFKLYAIWLLLFITFPVARLCFDVFQYAYGFLMESKTDFASDLKASTEKKVDKLLESSS